MFKNFAKAICIITLLTVIGCTTPLVEAKSADPKAIIELKVRESSFALIDILLKSQEDVKQICWSTDQMKTAFTKGVLGNRIYIWEVGDLEPVEVFYEEDIVSKFLWSPNSNYVIANVGTSIYRNGYLIEAGESKLIKKLSFIGRITWSPDSSQLAIGMERKIVPEVMTELSGTIDLVLYNVKDEQMNTLLYGSKDYYFQPLYWNKDGLFYEKIDFHDPSQIEFKSFIWK